MVAPYPAPRRFPEFPTTAQRRQRPGSHEPYGDLPGITCEYSRDLLKPDWIQATQEMNRNNPNGSSDLIIKIHPSSHYCASLIPPSFAFRGNLAARCTAIQYDIRASQRNTVLMYLQRPFITSPLQCDLMTLQFAVKRNSDRTMRV
ncbi:hypothetical protein EYF80_018641 [Liparis tanakae]|uniref:Uncharacterized protein n=1 Tax=Liparis tanakae TaxID=230148 RepID=A0A4Z2HZX8_9TELE|nr:hypothetical protein EYF80_018641 [Liparis tanakae]